MPTEQPKHPMQPLLRDDAGTIRFKANPIVRLLLDSGKIDMNDLACMSFSSEDREHFAQLIGYSVSGFGELPYVSNDAWRKAQRQAAKVEKQKQEGE